MNTPTPHRFLSDDELDGLLRRAVQSRPEPAARSDLAGRVLAAARAEVPAAPAARRGEWAAWIVAATALLAVLWFGFLRVAAIEAARSVYESTATVAGETASNPVGPLLVVGLGGLAAALVCLAVQASLSADDEPLRPGVA